MIIEKIHTCTITSNNGAPYDTWICATKSNKAECVYLNGERGGEYQISSIFRHALISSDDDTFTLAQSFNDDKEIWFSSSEIKRLASSILTSIPANIGELGLSVEFAPYDPRVPF